MYWSLGGKIVKHKILHPYTQSVAGIEHNIEGNLLMLLLAQHNLLFKFSLLIKFLVDLTHQGYNHIYYQLGY